MHKLAVLSTLRISIHYIRAFLSLKMNKVPICGVKFDREKLSVVELLIYEAMVLLKNQVI